MNSQTTALLISENEEILLNAFLKNDIDVLNDLIHPDAVFHLPNGNQLNKSMVLDNYRKGSSAMQSIVASGQQITCMGNTAVVSVILTAKGKYGEESFNTAFRYLRVWQLEGEKWKVIAVSGVPITVGA